MGADHPQYRRSTVTEADRERMLGTLGTGEALAFLAALGAPVTAPQLSDARFNGLVVAIRVGNPGFHRYTRESLTWWADHLRATEQTS